MIFLKIIKNTKGHTIHDQKFALSIMILFNLHFANAQAADFLDTQFGPEGLEVHLLKAAVSNKVLTIAFMIENSSDSEVKIKNFATDEALFTTADKKYPVLKDTNGFYLASTLAKRSTQPGVIFYPPISPEGKKFNPGSLRFKGKSKKVGWVKFEAPSDDEWPIELSLPGVTPFTISKP